MTPKTSVRSSDADATAVPGTEREIDLRLARLHLRTGSLGLARAEFEALVGEAPMDAAALADLAEVRWRTGDLPGAGDAAAAHMEEGGGEARALAIAAEAATAIGRVDEAGRLAAAAMARLDGSLVDLFAGMPRSEVWPDVGDDGRSAADEPSARQPEPVDAVPEAIADEEVEVSADIAEHAIATSDGSAEQPISSDGLTRGGAAADTLSSPADTLSSPADHLEAARRALAEGRLAAAAIRLGIVVRLEPALAPAVLDLAAGWSGPAFDLVRSDAYRIVGHELDAQRSLALAGAGLDDEDASVGSSDATERGHDAPARTTPDPAEPPTAELWPSLSEPDDPDR